MPLVSVVGRVDGDISQDFSAARRPHLHQEVVPPVLRQFGESKIEAGSRLRPGIHRSAEAVAASQPAIDGYQEQALAPRPVARINELTVKEYSVLNCYGVQFAGAHTDERVFRFGFLFFWHYSQSLPVSRGLPQPLERRMKEFFPRVRANNVAEQCVVFAPFQPVLSTGLLVCPSCREVFGRSQALIDNRVFAKGRSENLIAPGGQCLEQLLQTLSFNNNGVPDLQRLCSHRLECSHEQHLPRPD